MKGNFFQVSNMIFQFELRPISFLVYCYLKRCENKKHGSFPSKKKIEVACGIAHGSVDNALKELKEKYLIHVVPRIKDGCQQSNLYEFLELEDAWQLWRGDDSDDAVQEKEKIEAVPF